MKHLITGLIITLFLVLSFTILSASDEECVAGGGTWTTPSVSQGDDPASNTKKLQPFCQCGTGFYWNDSSKSCQGDKELRCGQTGGIWADNECQCPEGTLKWTEGFGCDMPGPEPIANTNTALGTEGTSENERISQDSLLLVSLFIVLLLIGVMVYFHFIKNRRKRGEK